jgi:uncharacterized protein
LLFKNSVSNSREFGQEKQNFEKRFAASLFLMAQTSQLPEMNHYIQHGKTSTLLHCIAVAYVSCRLAEILRISPYRQEIFRGAMLHDYFLYDWHEKDDSHRWHGFTHPEKALENANRDFKLSAREQDMIEKHMFPLTMSLPKYRESFLICLVDKGCSTYEVFCRDPYRGLREKFLPLAVGKGEARV